jgi:uncharacterized membrane protein YkvA (DUF1232 family)
MIERARGWAKRIKTDTVALYLAARDPRTPWGARIVAGLVVAYALSPLDLIPDFVPILGYLDDLLLVPLGILLALRLIPDPVLTDSRNRSREALGDGKPTSRAGLAIVLAIWLLTAGLCVWIVFWRR